MTARAILNDMMRAEQDRGKVAALEAAIDLIESVEVDNTAGEDENEHSWPVIGNVSTTTLKTLGLLSEERSKRK